MSKNTLPEVNVEYRLSVNDGAAEGSRRVLAADATIQAQQLAIRRQHHRCIVVDSSPFNTRQFTNLARRSLCITIK